MNLGTLLDLLAGGPGSGCHGPNCGRPSGHTDTRTAMKHALSSIKDDKTRKFASKAIAVMSKFKVDPRLFEGKGLKTFVHTTAASEGRDEQTVAYYSPKSEKLAMYEGGTVGDFIHEIGHHLDYKWFKESAQAREASKLDSDKVKNLVKQIHKEYKRQVVKRLGGKDPKKMWDKITNKGILSGYGLYNREEWFAESFREYFQNNDRLKAVAPVTHGALKEILEGRIFRT